MDQLWIDFPRSWPSLASISMTATFAYTGLLFACAIAASSFVLLVYFPWMRASFRSAFLLGYLVPTFAAAELGIILGFRDNLPWILVSISTSLPLLLIISETIAEAETRYEKNKLGTRRRRFILIGARLATPQMLLGLATCIPWAVLAAMLAEMTTGKLGLGIGLFNTMQYGFERALPYCIVAAALSVVPYFILFFSASRLREKFNLNERQLATEPLSLAYATNPTYEICFILVSVGILWTALNSRAPVLVPSWTIILDRLSHRELFLVLTDAILRTAAAGIMALFLGFLIGATAALAAYKNAFIRSVVVSVLMLIQILPLIVFIPLVAVFQRSIDTQLFSPSHGHIQDANWIGSLFSGVLIATLACAYTAYHAAAARLDALPEGLGPLIRSRGSLAKWKRICLA